MMMGNGWGWMWLFGLLVLVGIVLLIVVAVRAVAGVSSRGTGGPPASGRGTARDVLDERYARGELTTDEYRERLRTLDEGR